MFQFRLHSLNPILVDINIYYRMLKAIYSENAIVLNMHGAMYYQPLLMGCWHCYVHCVKRVYRRFHTYWATLEYRDLLHGDDRTLGVKVYSFPKIFTLEFMVTAMFLLQGPCTNRVRQWAEDLRVREPGTLRQQQACMLNLLLN